MGAKSAHDAESKGFDSGAYEYEEWVAVCEGGRTGYH